MNDDAADAVAFRNLRKCCGYIENGTDATVRVFQDDATRTWHVNIGLRRYWSENSLHEALERAAADVEED